MPLEVLGMKGVTYRTVLRTLASSLAGKIPTGETTKYMHRVPTERLKMMSQQN